MLGKTQPRKERAEGLPGLQVLYSSPRPPSACSPPICKSGELFPTVSHPPGTPPCHRKHRSKAAATATTLLNGSFWWPKIISLAWGEKTSGENVCLSLFESIPIAHQHPSISEHSGILGGDPETPKGQGGGLVTMRGCGAQAEPWRSQERMCMQNKGNRSGESPRKSESEFVPL